MCAVAHESSVFCCLLFKDRAEACQKLFASLCAPARCQRPSLLAAAARTCTPSRYDSQPPGGSGCENPLRKPSAPHKKLITGWRRGLVVFSHPLRDGSAMPDGDGSRTRRSRSPNRWSASQRPQRPRDGKALCSHDGDVDPSSRHGLAAPLPCGAQEARGKAAQLRRQPLGVKDRRGPGLRTPLSRRARRPSLVGAVRSLGPPPSRVGRLAVRTLGLLEAVGAAARAPAQLRRRTRARRVAREATVARAAPLCERASPQRQTAAPMDGRELTEGISPTER